MMFQNVYPTCKSFQTSRPLDKLSLPIAHETDIKQIIFISITEKSIILSYSLSYTLSSEIILQVCLLCYCIAQADVSLIFPTDHLFTERVSGLRAS